MSGNVATVSLGTSSRQFVRLSTGNWVSTGGGHGREAGPERPARAYEYKCHTTNPPPYAMQRGWDISNVSFDVADGSGNTQHFANWVNIYASYGTQNCGQAKGFRLTDWTFANGVRDTVTYGDAQDPNAYDARGIGIERITSVSNSLGRQLNFEAVTTGANGETYIVDNNLTGAALRMIGFALDSTTGSRVAGQSTFTDPAGQNTIVSLNGWVMQSYTQNEVAYQAVNQIFYPDHPSLPAIEYDYDTLGRISQIRDAINLQVGPASAGGRDPTRFYIAAGGRGERDDPLGRGVCGLLRPVGPPQPLPRRARPRDRSACRPSGAGGDDDLPRRRPGGLRLRRSQQSPVAHLQCQARQRAGGPVSGGLDDLQ